eukprot:6210074-Pleurochrysis_carterae.AAC.1
MSKLCCSRKAFDGWWPCEACALDPCLPHVPRPFRLRARARVRVWGRNSARARACADDRGPDCICTPAASLMASGEST